MEPLSLNARTRAGRPTQAQARRRHDELLARALEQFLEHGFGQATMESIMASVGMTKRTVYNLYPDKQALFRAAVQRAIERFSFPAAQLKALESDDLGETLYQIARTRIDKVNTPVGLQLMRIVNAESTRFPELLMQVYEQDTRPTIEFLEGLLRRRAKAGDIDVDKPEIAASAFFSMAVSGPVRALVAGYPIDNRLLEERLHYCVRLFLDGTRPRRKAADRPIPASLAPTSDC